MFMQDLKMVKIVSIITEIQYYITNCTSITVLKLKYVRARVGVGSTSVRWC